MSRHFERVGRRQVERQQDEAEIHHQGPDHQEHRGDPAMGDQGGESGEYRHPDRGEGEQNEDPQCSQVAQVDGRPTNVGNVPYDVHRALGRQPEPNRAVDEENTPDDHCSYASSEGMGVRVQLRTNDRKVSEGAVDEVFLQLLIVMEGVTENGREHEQEWEERKEAVVGDERRLGTCLVVAELLNNRKREAENTVILLELVDPAYERFDRARPADSFLNLAVVRRSLGRST